MYTYVGEVSPRSRGDDQDESKAIQAKSQTARGHLEKASARAEHNRNAGHMGKGVLAVLPLETSRHRTPGTPLGAAHRSHTPYVARSSSASGTLHAFPSSHALRPNLPPSSVQVPSSYGPSAWPGAGESMRHCHRLPCRTCIRPAGRMAHAASLNHLRSLLRFCSRSAAVKTSSREVWSGRPPEEGRHYPRCLSKSRLRRTR